MTWGMASGTSRPLEPAGKSIADSRPLLSVLSSRRGCGILAVDPANGSAVFQGELSAIDSLDFERWFADFKFDNEGFEEPIHS